MRRLRCVADPEPVRRVPGDVLIHLRRSRDHIDRTFAEPIDLDTLAAIAGMSKYHFLRSFRTTYGITPAAYVSQRRIERAQDLLRSANLTVTEVCVAVGYSSLGSFSTRFADIVGESPRDFQRRYAGAGAPRIPGCHVFMRGLVERRVSRTADETTAQTAIEEKRDDGAPS